MTLTATVKRTDTGQRSFDQLWRGVLVDEHGGTRWQCGHSHSNVTGPKSAMDCAVYELARRNANANPTPD